MRRPPVTSPQRVSVSATFQDEPFVFAEPNQALEIRRLGGGSFVLGVHEEFGGSGFDRSAAVAAQIEFLPAVLADEFGEAQIYQSYESIVHRGDPDLRAA